MYKKIPVVISCLFFFFTSLRAQEYLDLHYHFDKGDQFQVHQHANQETYLTLKDVPQRTTNQMDAVLLLTVRDVTEGGGATLDAEYKKISLQSSQDNLNVSVNTEAASDDVFNRLFKALIGKKFTISMDADGTIDTITGMGAIFDQMIGAVQGVKEKEKPVLKTFLENQMGAEQVKANLAVVLPYYPQYKVRTGDSWSSHLYTEGFYHGRIDNYWKLTYGTRYMVKLENKGQFGTDASEEVDLGGGQKGRMDLNGEMIGKYVIDPATSWPSMSIIHTELTGKYTYIMKKKNMDVPVRIVKDASYQIKHL